MLHLVEGFIENRFFLRINVGVLIRSLDILALSNYNFLSLKSMKLSSSDQSRHHKLLLKSILLYMTCFVEIGVIYEPSSGVRLKNIYHVGKSSSILKNWTTKNCSNLHLSLSQNEVLKRYSFPFLGLKVRYSLLGLCKKKEGGKNSSTFN